MVGVYSKGFFTTQVRILGEGSIPDSSIILYVGEIRIYICYGRCL